MTKLVEIGKFDNAIDAHYTLDVLADAGIEGDVFDENAGSAMPYIGAIGVRVVVREEDAERARAALASAPARLTFVDDEEDRDEAYSEDGDGEKPSLSPAEAWAARTRTIAFVGIGVWIVAVVALARLMRPPAGVDVSVRARRWMRQARWAAAISFVLLTLFLLAITGVLGMGLHWTWHPQSPRGPLENPFGPS